nr:hypothetical protein [Tanacetum cinerariifolium]
ATRIETTEEGTKILTTVDGILRTVTESSLRRNLKLQDEAGIRFNEFSSNIATALVCLATNRTYNFLKMIFDVLVKNVNNKGEGLGTPIEPHHIPSPKALPTSHTTYSSPTLPPVSTAPIPTVTPSETTPIRQYTRRARIAQSSALPPVADEPASPLRDVSQGEACPTDSGFIADQDRANIATSSTLPYDPAPRVTSPAAVEGSMQHTIDNMVAILEKSKHNVDFHPIVDFVEASPLRYALTFKPTVYVSHIRQFWSATRIETTEEGTKILTTVDGILRTVTESSLRRNLKLQDEEGIRFNEFSSNIATALVCLATNRIYNFSKMIFDGLVKNVNNKGEGSGTPIEPHHTPSPKALLTSHTTYSSPTLPPISTAPIPTVTSSETTPIRQYSRRARIAQSSALLPVADEPASPLRDVSQGEDCPTDSGFIADQDRANIATSSNLPYDPAPRVTSPTAVEGSMQHTIDVKPKF